MSAEAFLAMRNATSVAALAQVEKSVGTNIFFMFVSMRRIKFFMFACTLQLMTHQMQANLILIR